MSKSEIFGPVPRQVRSAENYVSVVFASSFSQISGLKCSFLTGLFCQQSVLEDRKLAALKSSEKQGGKGKRENCFRSSHKTILFQPLFHPKVNKYRKSIVGKR